MMRAAGLEFDVVPSGIDEQAVEARLSGAVDPERLVRTLAREKVRSVASSLGGEDAIVVGGDTVGWLDGRVLGKPSSDEEAVSFIKSLAGRSHEIFTAIVVVRTGTGRWFEAVDRSVVTFDQLSDEEARGYVEWTREQEGRAAAYSVLEAASLFVARVEGSPSGVAGLPMHHLGRAFRALGVPLFRPGGTVKEVGR